MPNYVEWRMLLHRWSHFYYVLDKPQTDDRLFDINYNDYKEHEAKGLVKKTKSSPTSAVGCGCPICKPKNFTPAELKVWKKLTEAFDLSPPKPKKVKAKK